MILSTVTVLCFAPLLAGAAPSRFYYAGWLPFWKKETGAVDMTNNLMKIHEVSPFSYEVNGNGTLKDALKIKEGFWPRWLAAIRGIPIKNIPTIAWFDAAGVHTLLSNTKARRAHEDAIAKLVKDNRFDGIDIDYEGKMAKTSPYFSLLIKGLALRLHPYNKILSCTIEARTPLSSLENSHAPERKPSYANDYAVLNKYCDQVRIMAYDQGTIDIQLNAAKGDGNLYAPVADSAWVEKVIKEATKTISKKKIMLGVPTYGYEYQVSWASSTTGGTTTYQRIRSVNFSTAYTLAGALGISATRNSAGELSFMYTTSTFYDISGGRLSTVTSSAPMGPSGPVTNSTSSVTRFISLSDAGSVGEKIALAKKYDLRGVVFFKLDGEFDPLIWGTMKQ